MPTRDELMKAVRMIRDCCRREVDCEDCLLSVFVAEGRGHYCCPCTDSLGRNTVPAEWEVPT